MINRRRLSLMVLVVFVAWLVEPAIGSSLGAQTAARAATAATRIRDLIGQKLMVAMKGTTPSTGLLGRIERGEIGGVILYTSNIRTARQLARLTKRLRRAAADGGQPPLLIATDQEGGAVKRVTWAPPTLSPPQMGSIGLAPKAYAQGKATGRVLGCAGINNDLAPVADVPSSTSSFMYQEGRTWSFDASLTASLSDAFASGLEAGHGVPTMKHFPGIGFATETTDANVVTITASKAALAPGLRPYKRAIGHHIPLIMLSNATYTAYDSANAAGWSHAVSIGLLRRTLGFTGVSITDSLNGTAAARGVSPNSLAIKASKAGTDMILLTGSEVRSAEAYASLVRAARNGNIPRSRLQTSYQRILAMKAQVAPPPADMTAPTVNAPTSHLVSGSTLGTTTTPVDTTWSAMDTCHIASYTLERQQNGGAWVGQFLTTEPSTSIRQSLRLGTRYRYRAKAMDGAGNSSAWVYGRPFRPRRTEQSESAVTYRGTWHIVSSRDASGGSLAYSTAANASARFTFNAYDVSWVSARGPNRGQAAIYIDGDYKRTVDLYSPTYHARRVVYANHWAQNGSHTLKVVNLATAGRSRIDIDAFVWLLAT
jgi:beta-N-acetylhexosaminidase